MQNRTSTRRTLLCCAAALAAASAAAQAGEIAGKVEAAPPKYLEETVVYVEKAPGPFTPKKHAMDQKGMKFLPHVMAIAEGDTVSFKNSDGVDHNVYTPDNEGYNLGMIAGGKSGDYVFKKAGVYSQLCSVHPEMLAYVFVGQNPYAAVVGKDGRFKIAGVPPGQYSVAVWNSKLKAAPLSVTVTAGKPAEANFSVKR
jgi:plastocyanin